jgi:hypothetical protein
MQGWGLFLNFPLVTRKRTGLLRFGSRNASPCSLFHTWAANNPQNKPKSPPNFSPLDDWESSVLSSLLKVMYNAGKLNNDDRMDGWERRRGNLPIVGLRRQIRFHPNITSFESSEGDLYVMDPCENRSGAITIIKCGGTKISEKKPTLSHSPAGELLLM